MASSTLVTLMLLTLLATPALAQALGSAPASLLTRSSSPTSSPPSHAPAPTSKPPTPSLAPTPSATPPSPSSAPSTSPPAPPPPIAPTPSNAPPPHAGLPTVMASHGHGGHHYDNTNNFGPRRRLQPSPCPLLCGTRCGWLFPALDQAQARQSCKSYCQNCCGLCHCVPPYEPPPSRTNRCPGYYSLRDNGYTCP